MKTTEELKAMGAEEIADLLPLQPVQARKLRADLAFAEAQAGYWKRSAMGYRDALEELVGSIPLEKWMGIDHPIVQAVAQANLVLREGAQ